MSLVSRTPSDLFASLLHRGNPEEIALKFVLDYADDAANRNLQLTDLVFRCCGLTHIVPVPSELVRDENVTDIVDSIESVISSTGCPKLSMDRRLCDRALKFFESFWFLYWSEYANEDTSSFFKKLILALSEIDVPIVIFFCNGVLSKFVTSLFKNHAEISELQMRSVYELIHHVMPVSFKMRNRRLLKLTLRECEQWLRFRPDELMDHKFLRYIIWPLKDSASEVILIGLEILETLMTVASRNLPQMFLQRCGETFLCMDELENDQVFTRVCECCVLIHSKFPHVIPEKFHEQLAEHLFSTEANKVSAARAYWLAVNYDPDDHFQTLCKMISCIDSIPDDDGRKFIGYFIDALIEECPALTNWNLFAEIAAHKYKEKLTAEERDVLLMIIVHAGEQAVRCKKPRGHNNVNMKAIDSAEIRRNITVAFTPHLKDLFDSSATDDIAVLLKVMTLFDFNFLPPALNRNLIQICLSCFQGVRNVLVQRLIIDLLWIMKENCADETSEICLESIQDLKRQLETQVKNVFFDFLDNPTNYSDSVRGDELDGALLALRVIHVVMPVEKSVAFDLAIQIMRADLPAQWNPTFMAVRESCLILSTSHIMKILDDEPFSSSADTTINELFMSTSNVKEAVLLALYFGVQLMEFVESRSGLVVFVSLCDLALKFKDRGLEKQFPSATIDYMSDYFVTALSQPQSEEMMHEHAMKRYLEMINQDIISMEDAYDALSIHCNVDDVKYIRCLHRFLEEQCEKRGTKFMAEWMTNLWKQFYEEALESIKEEKCLWVALEKLRDLVYSISPKIQDFVYQCHIVGIDYTVSETKCAAFARILSLFSPCLDASNRHSVLQYALSKEVNTPAMQVYIYSLETEEKLKPVVSIPMSPAQDSEAASSLSPLDTDDQLSGPGSVISFTDEESVSSGDDAHDRPSSSSTGSINFNNCSPIHRMREDENSSLGNDGWNPMEMDDYNMSFLTAWFSSSSSGTAE